MKKQKSVLSTKLKSYSALAGSLIAVVGSANAQVVYTNITDYTGATNGDTYMLDLNNDGTNDFSISLNLTTITSTSGVTTIRQINANKMGLNQVNSFSGSAYALSAGAPIAASNSWGVASNAIMALGVNYINLGKWVGATDQFLGLKLVKGGNTYYSWARLDVSGNSDKFTIKDYAYEATKNKAIKAGNKGISTGIVLNADANMSVYAADRKIKVELGNDANAFISIKNVLGQEMQNISSSEKSNLIDMGSSPEGVYFVTVQQGDMVSTSKVYLH